MAIEQSKLDMIALQAIMSLSGADRQDLKDMPIDLLWRMYSGIVQQRYELATLWLAVLLIPRAEVLDYELSPAMSDLAGQLEDLSIAVLAHKADDDAIRAGAMENKTTLLSLELGLLSSQFSNPFTHLNAPSALAKILHDLMNQCILFQEFSRVYRTDVPAGVMLHRALNQPKRHGNMLAWLEHMQRVLALIELLPSFKQVRIEHLRLARDKAAVGPGAHAEGDTLMISEDQIRVEARKHNDGIPYSPLR